MGHLGVVLVDEERDQGVHTLDGVEGVKEQPVMFQGAPLRLDHRVGLAHLDLGEDAVKAFGQKGSVDGGVDVLDAGIGHDRDLGSWFGGNEMLAGLDQNAACCDGIEARTDGPSQELQLANAGIPDAKLTLGKFILGAAVREAKKILGEK